MGLLKMRNLPTLRVHPFRFYTDFRCRLIAHRANKLSALFFFYASFFCVRCIQTLFRNRSSPVLRINYLELELLCPQNGSVILKGLSRSPFWELINS